MLLLRVRKLLDGDKPGIVCHLVVKRCPLPRTLQRSSNLFRGAHEAEGCQKSVEVAHDGSLMIGGSILFGASAQMTGHGLQQVWKCDSVHFY